MTSWPAGRSYASGDGLTARQPPDARIQVLVDGDEDFDREVDGLRSQVNALKHLAEGISEESRMQREEMGQLEELLERGKIMMSKNMQRINQAMQQNSSNSLIMLLLFALAAFTLIWIFGKIKGLVHMFAG